MLSRDRHFSPFFSPLPKFFSFSFLVAFYYNDTLSTYMADEYSIRWMQDTEGNWSTNSETLITQYLDVESMVKQSHPQKVALFFPLSPLKTNKNVKKTQTVR